MQRTFRLLLGACALLCTLALAAAAQTVNVTGIWDITMGQVTRTLTLKQDGNKIMGSIKGPAGSFDLEDGTIDGVKIKFSADLTVQGRKIHRDYVGTVDGDTIKGTVNDGTNTNQFVAKPGQDRTYPPN